MNCIQQHMISGSHRAGNLENLADTCNAIPMYMWRDRDIKVFEGEGLQVAFRYEAHCYNESDCAPTAVFFGSCYSVAALGASLFLSIGLSLKKIAFCIDPRAHEYNQLAVKCMGELDGLNEIKQSKDDYLQTMFREEKLLKDQELLYNVLKEDIEKNRPTNSMESFVGTNPHFMLAYHPFIAQDVTDYRISTFSVTNSYNPDLPYSFNSLAQKISEMKEKIESLRIRYNEAESQLAKLNEPIEQFIANVKKIYPSESQPLLSRY